MQGNSASAHMQELNASSTESIPARASVTQSVELIQCNTCQPQASVKWDFHWMNLTREVGELFIYMQMFVSFTKTNENDICLRILQTTTQTLHVFAKFTYILPRFTPFLRPHFATLPINEHVGKFERCGHTFAASQTSQLVRLLCSY